MSKNRESIKRAHELNVFLAFADREGLDCDRRSVNNGNPLLKEPDILYRDQAGTLLGFELSRLTDPTLESAVNSRNALGDTYLRLGGYSRRSLVQKLRKSYSLSPVSLLLYTERIGTPDTTLIPQVRLDCMRRNGYAMIWFMSKRVVKVLRG